MNFIISILYHSFFIHLDIKLNLYIYIYLLFYITNYYKIICLFMNNNLIVEKNEIQIIKLTNEEKKMDKVSHLNVDVQ